MMDDTWPSELSFFLLLCREEVPIPELDLEETSGGSRSGTNLESGCSPNSSSPAARKSNSSSAFSSSDSWVKQA